MFFNQSRALGIFLSTSFALLACGGAPSDGDDDLAAASESEAALGQGVRLSVAGEWTSSRQRFTSQSATTLASHRESDRVVVQLARVPRLTEFGSDPFASMSVAASVTFRAPNITVTRTGGGPRRVDHSALCERGGFYTAALVGPGVSCSIWGKDQTGQVWQTRLMFDPSGSLVSLSVNGNNMFDTFEFKPAE